MADQEPVKPLRRSRLWRFVWRVIYFLVFVLILLAVGVYFLYRSTQFPPEFYQLALDVDEEISAVEGDEFEVRILNLQNDARSNEQWQAIFTEAQINGWIASDVPEKFPDLLPDAVLEPRVFVSPGELKVTFLAKSKTLKGYVIASADAFCTESGEVALRFNSVKSGLLKISIAVFADTITKALRKSEVEVEWTEIDGDPVALLKLPDDLVTLDEYQVRLTGIKVGDGQIVLVGESVRP